MGIAKAVLGCALFAGAGVGVRVAAWPIARAELPRRTDGPTLEAAPVAPAGRDSIARATVARDPFRITRRPSPVAYDRLRLGQPAVSPAPKPALVLAGVVWDGGKDPTALLEGLPGAEGARVVRSGETIGGLRVTRIERQRVVIVGLDTAWVLVVRELWR